MSASSRPRLRPTQPANLWQSLPTQSNFSRDYEVQDSVPVDGSNVRGRVYSPFVIRTLLPAILGGNGENTLTDTRSDPPTDYAGAIRGVATVPPSQASYEALANVGATVPGFATASVTEVAARYNQARITQLYSHRAQQVAGNRAGSTTVVPAITNDLSALAALLQLKQIAATPPLIMLINPESMSIDYAKVAQLQERGRKGFIYQAWGEELPKLSFSFRIGAYVAGQPAPDTRTVSGMQRASRNDSAAWQQLMAMLVLFQSSGNVHDTLGGSRATWMIGNLAIEYDQKVYVGHMDTFSFGEEETNANGGVQFQMDFVAVREYDLAEVPAAVNPMAQPTNPLSQRGGRGTLSRTGTQQSFQVFTAPTIGFSGSAPPQPWSGGAAAVNPDTQALVTRRRV